MKNWLQIKSEEYYVNSISIPLDFSTNNTIILNKKVLSGLNKIFKKGYLYQKAGIILSGLETENTDLNLFKEDDKKLDWECFAAILQTC